MPRADAEQRYAALASSLIRTPGVTQASGGRGFGSSGQLKINDRIFAMLVGENLVLKLPRATVDALVARRQGKRFDPRRNGHLMKEWLVLSAGSQLDWLSLTREACAYVSGEQR